jgi:hypothetical protein
MSVAINTAPTGATGARPVHGPEPVIDFDALWALARLREHHQAPGTILGVSAITALLLDKLLVQLGKVSDHLAVIAAPSELEPPPSSGADPNAAKPAAIGGTDTRRARVAVSAALDKASVDALGTAVSTALAVAVHAPFAEVNKKIAETNADLFKLQTQQGVEQRRVIDLHETNEALIREMRELRMSQLAAAERFGGLYAQYQGTVRQLRDLYKVVSDMGVELGTVEEAADLLERHVEAVDEGVSAVAAELQRQDEPPARTAHKPPQKKR